MDLGQKLRGALRKISGKAYIDEDGVKALIKEIQRVLISSDVNIKLVFELSKRIEKNALDKDKMKELNLKEHVLKVVYDELTLLMGGEEYTPKINKQKILVCGLFGSGKTTSIGKLAYYYKKRGLSVLVVGADCDRPAAKEQLEQLANKAGVNFYTNKNEKDAEKIVREAMDRVDRTKEDVIIVDTAGRSALNDELSDKLKQIHKTFEPDETYLVVSADIGQVAGKQAEAFENAINIDGVVITKLEGSGKGGGALSAVASTKSKIVFIGTGEKLRDLEVYSAERFVGKLLGIPDIKGLIEKVREVSKEQDLSKLDDGKFTIKTFYEQLKAAKKMGPLGNVLGMMGVSDLPKNVVRENENKLKLYEAMINSMTDEEKEEAQLLRKSMSRIERIAVGSGTSVREVRGFLSQFEKINKVFNKFKKDRGFRKKVEKMMSGGGFNLPGMPKM